MGMWPYLSKELKEIYDKNNDNRKMRLAKHDELLEEANVISKMGEEQELLLRDARCLELAHLWTHHLTSEARAALPNVKVSLVPPSRRRLKETAVPAGPAGKAFAHAKSRSLQCYNPAPPPPPPPPPPP